LISDTVLVNEELAVFVDETSADAAADSRPGRVASCAAADRLAA
jgi:hypothetical protein